MLVSPPPTVNPAFILESLYFPLEGRLVLTNAMRSISQFARRPILHRPIVAMLAGYSHAQQVSSPPIASSNTDTVRITLPDAIDRARRNSVEFQAAVTDAAIAREDRNQARDALLPSVKYDNSGIYTQGNGPGSPIRFIANNAVHEYISQGNVHESFDLAALAVHVVPPLSPPWHERSKKLR